MSAELFSVLDIILRQIRNNNIPFGEVMFLCSMDHTQLSPIKGEPLLVSSHILSCFKMFRLEHSVRANEDLDFQRLQQISRMNLSKYTNNPHRLNEFRQLASETITFFNNWNCPEIDSTTYGLYG